MVDFQGPTVNLPEAICLLGLVTHLFKHGIWKSIESSIRRRVPGLVNVYITKERSTMLMGKSTISTGPFSIVFGMFTRGYASWGMVTQHLPIEFGRFRAYCAYQARPDPRKFVQRKCKWNDNLHQTSEESGKEMPLQKSPKTHVFIVPYIHIRCI